jgi:hypothetical protein
MIVKLSQPRLNLGKIFQSNFLNTPSKKYLDCHNDVAVENIEVGGLAPGLDQP